ncbi:MAG: hypothetical protein WA728_04955 [Xanthobacteraceae bacterium]
MTKYIRADGKNKPRFDFRGYPRGLPGRLLIFSAVLSPLDRTDWIYAIGSDQYLTEPERLLGIQIINHLNLERQECHPDQAILAWRLGRGRRTIVDRLRFIKRAGWLAVRAQPRSGAKRAGRLANEYAPTIPIALLDAIRESIPELNKVQPGLHINVGELSAVRTPNYVQPGLRTFREGIDNKKERGFREELTMKEPNQDGKLFIAADSEEFAAWSKVRRWPQTDHRINGRIQRGWWFPSLWPNSEKPEPNDCSAAEYLRSWPRDLTIGTEVG